MTKPKRFLPGGVIPPVVTPLTSGRDIDPDAFEKQLLYVVEAGVSGVFVSGTCGEGAGLTNWQRLELLKQSVDVVGGRVPILAGILEPSTPRVIEQVESTAAAGATAIVVTTPYYYESDPSDQLYHFRAIAQASPVPVILYNIPVYTHNCVTSDTVRRLLSEENIVAIKDSAGDWPAFKELLSLRASRPGFAVLQGSEKRAAQSLLAGADGIIPSKGNLLPSLFVDLVDAARRQDIERVNALHDQVIDLASLNTHGYWLSCLKYGLSLIGLGEGYTLSHHQSLTEPAKAEIRKLVERYTAV